MVESVGIMLLNFLIKMACRPSAGIIYWIWLQEWASSAGIMIVVVWGMHFPVMLRTWTLQKFLRKLREQWKKDGCSDQQVAVQLTSNSCMSHSEKRFRFCNVDGANTSSKKQDFDELLTYVQSAPLASCHAQGNALVNRLRLYDFSRKLTTLITVQVSRNPPCIGAHATYYRWKPTICLVTFNFIWMCVWKMVWKMDCKVMHTVFFYADFCALFIILSFFLRKS